MVSSASSSAHSCFICFESIQPTHNRFCPISLQIPIKERRDGSNICVFLKKAMNCAHKVLDKMHVRAFSTGMMEGISMGQLLRSVYEPQDLIVKTSTQNHKVSAILVFGDFTSDPGNNNYILTPFRGNFPPYGRDFANQKAAARCTNGKKTQS
ncbi:unnamed protein product [Lactuca saligna]|uniref:Uncharacterized protein n=1 Tax=Lactuca saligna TaxID=75948 RepID=A0AA36DY59_LACSI|nr:unnamed protein product [Lactuca saligna]